ncbi:transposable element Tcb1 transposase [Trichonephila clavipes]|nr:transposable element Tcb1 transposase [Trichonephila clavipes]
MTFLRGRIIGLLFCERTQLEVSEELGITQSVISRLWQRFQAGVTSTTVSTETVHRLLCQIGLYVRPVRCVLLTATQCRLWLAWSREHGIVDTATVGLCDVYHRVQDDNTRPHRANIGNECLQSEDIIRMGWSEFSPDLNPVEHVWDMLGRRVSVRQPTPTCLLELRRALLDEWCNIPQD